MTFFSPHSRRTALKKIALGAAALATPGWGRSRSSKDGKLGVALVGLGYYSTDLLAPALQMTEHCYLAGIVTGTPAKVPVWQRKYGIKDRNVYDYGNFDTIIRNNEIDIVYVVLPNSLHAEFVIRAALAGKHVWCEKPMAVNAEQCEAMIEACRSSQVQLSIGYRMQHEPVTNVLMTLAGRPEYGAVKHISTAAGYYGAYQNDPENWKISRKMGGGAMYDMGVYCLQAARYTTGEEPIAVTAQHHTTRPTVFTEVDETTTFKLEFPSGAIAQCATSFGMNNNHLHATYERGWAKLDPFSSYNNVGGTASGSQSLSAWLGNQQARQMDADALAIKNQQPVRVPGEEGLRDIRIVEAVYQSAKTGERVTLG